jgi:glycosyltransferase involved in cell wall biosynthesis
MILDANKPAVSVLIPVYNGGKFFRAAVESVLAQTFRDFECLILNDGSTDGSGAVADELARNDSRVRVVHRENRGLVATLNELVAAARGELIARMDADDLCMPTRLEKQVDFFSRRPETVCLGSSHWLIDERDRSITVIRPPGDDASIQRLALAGHTAICHPSAMMRTASVRDLGGYRDEFYPTEDLDLWLRLGEIGALANLTEPLICYRMHSASISGQATQGRQRDAARRSCAAAWSRRGMKDAQFEANDEWRPDETPASRMSFALQYGWMAYSSGFRKTAMIYALKAIRLLPGRKEGWRLLAVSLLRRSAVAGRTF